MKQTFIQKIKSLTCKHKYGRWFRAFNGWGQLDNVEYRYCLRCHKKEINVEFTELVFAKILDKLYSKEIDKLKS